MKRIAYQLVAMDLARVVAGPQLRAETDAFVRPGRAHLGRPSRPSHSIRHSLQVAAFVITVIAATISPAETRPHYGGTLRVMLQSSPAALELPANATPTDHWDAARVLSLIGDTLVTIDAQARPHPALALSWQSDPNFRQWQFTLRAGVKFSDGSAASPAAVAQILGASHPNWNVRASADSVSIESETSMPSLPAELALPRNLLLKRNTNSIPIGTGLFLVSEWQTGKLLKLAANEESWAGRPFVDAVEIEFGKSLRDQALALELGRADLIETAPQAVSGSQRSTASSSSSSSLPVELLALVFPSTSKAQDQRVREALALAIDRKPIHSVILKGVGEPSAGILPNWMTGYNAVFSIQPNVKAARNLLAELRLPALNLSYDPRDPQAQLVAERIALNARDVGITVQVSLSGSEDIRLVRIALPSPAPSVALVDVATKLGILQLLTPVRGDSVENLFRSESSLLEGYNVIPLFHLPVSLASGERVHGWQPGLLGSWNEPGSSLANVWLSDSRPEIGPR